MLNKTQTCVFNTLNGMGGQNKLFKWIPVYL